MKQIKVEFGGVLYTIKISFINTIKPQYIVTYISPEFPLYNPVFEVDLRTATVNFHKSEFHKSIWSEIQRAFEQLRSNPLNEP